METLIKLFKLITNPFVMIVGIILIAAAVIRKKCL